MHLPELLWRISGYTPRRLCNQKDTYTWLVKCFAPPLSSSVKILEKSNAFVILSTGRTGTTWLSSLLNNVKGACVAHEPIVGEQSAHTETAMHPERADEYIRSFRVREMALRSSGRKAEIYGEVNGALRRHVKALRDVVPSIRVIHLVRDGRDVVSSVLSRDAFTEKDPRNDSFVPNASEIAPQEWAQLDRFGKICWMWANENKLLRKNTDKQAKFEEILGSYSAFCRQIANPLNISLPESVWEKAKAKPKNTTPSGKKLTYKDWPAAQKETFWELCGEEMAQYGYER